jgi:hypothetical protein
LAVIDALPPVRRATSCCDGKKLSNGGWYQHLQRTYPKFANKCSNPINGSNHHPSFSEYDTSDSPPPSTTTASSRISSMTRRNAVTASASIMLPSFMGSIPRANAISPLTSAELDQWPNRLERQLFRPKPTVNLLRPKLNLDFAVFLMRSSYNALDELDCVAMDQFQRDFFLFRQSEYAFYTQHLGGQGGIVQQGMLQDPYYFDFISFAQYATIAREMSQNPPLLFEEQQPQPTNPTTDDNDDDTGLVEQRFVKALVRRKDKYSNNDLLPQFHDEMVGTAIVQRFEGMYRESGSSNDNNNNNKTLYSIELNSRPSVEVVLASLKLLIQLFVANGFALDGSATTTNGTKTFVLTLQSPAILWSGKALQRRNCHPTNDFVRKAASALLQREGYQMINSSLKHTNTEEITTFQIL